MKFNRPLDGWTPPKVWLTASALGVSAFCPRNAIIDNYFNHNGMYDNWHAQFGTALGAACSAISEHWDGSNELETLRQAWIASLPFPAEASIGFKDLGSLWLTIYTFFRHWKMMYSDGWRFAGAEKQIIADLGDETYTGGSYDLKICKDNRCKIIDFKAVGSNYFYAWEYDPQVVWYTVLDALSERKDPYECDASIGGSILYYPPEYWTFVFKSDGMVLEIFDVRPSVFKTIFSGSIAFLVDNASSSNHLYRLWPQDDQTYLDAVEYATPVNPAACMRGNFACFNFAVCHEDKPINWAPIRSSYADAHLRAIETSPAELRSIASSIVSSWEPESNAQLMLDDADIDYDLFLD